MVVAKAPYTLNLFLKECQDLASVQDVMAVAEVVSGFGLCPAEGAWTPDAGPRPVDDVPAFLGRVRFAIEEIRQATQPPAVRPRRRDPFEGAEQWGFAVVTPEPPAVGGTLTISRAVRGSWAVSLTFYTWHFERAGQPLETFAAAWGERLARLGDALYQRARPALGLLIAHTAASQEVDYGRAVADRRFLVGWRTWFGPPYAEPFGREWLLGLPDEATPLEDGGVRHALSAPASALTAGDPAVYASLWPYLKQAGVTPAWPRPPRAPRRRTQADADRALTEVRRAMHAAALDTGSERDETAPGANGPPASGSAAPDASSSR